MVALTPAHDSNLSHHPVPNQTSVRDRIEAPCTFYLVLADHSLTAGLAKRGEHFLQPIAAQPPSPDHDSVVLLEPSDALKRITSNQQQIGPLTNGNCAELFLFSQEQCWIDCCRADRFVRGEAALHQ